MPLTFPRAGAPGPRPRATARPLRAGFLAALGLAAGLGPAAGQTAPPPASASERRVPEALNFANGLFRERRYKLAAQEYERFLKDARPGPDADDARFGLANAWLFEGEYAKARAQFETFLRQAPAHPNAATAWYRVGETSYMLGDLPAARKAFETYTREHPTHKHADTAWPYLGDVCLRAGDVAEARRAYERALKDHPSGRLADRARFGLGRALALQGETDRALAAFTALAESGGKDWADRAWFQVGQVQAGSKHWDEAARAFARVEEVAPQSPLIPEARLNRAEALVAQGKGDEAAPVLEALATEGKQTLAARAALALGTVRLQAGRAEEALAGLDEASKKFAGTPSAAALVFRSAEAAWKLGRLDDAGARFLRAFEADPADPWADEALARAAQVALERHDVGGADRLAAAFAEKFPASPHRAEVRLVAARAALARDKPKEAITALTASLAGDKPDPATAEAQRYYLGLAYRADGQPAKAAEVLDALAKTPAAGLAANAQFMLGQGHVEAGRYAEAVRPLEKYLAARPDGDVADLALAYLVQARLELGEADEAQKALDALAERFPKSQVLPRTRLRVARAAQAAEQYDKAADQLARAAGAEDPAVANLARLDLGWARLRAGKPAEAAAAFAAVLESAPDDPLAPEAALARGRALEADKQVEPALAAYALAAEKYPKSEEANLAALARARLLAEAKRPAEAADAYAAFVKDHPRYTPRDKSAPGPDAVLDDWAWALVDAGKPDQADAVFKRLLDEFPDSPHADDARFNLAESAHQAGDHEATARLLAPLVAEGSKAPPRLVQSALYRLGRTQAEQKDWSSAAKTLDRLLQEFPDGLYRREAGLLRADVALEAGDAAAAEPLLSALAAGPADPNDPPGFAAAVKRRRVKTLLALKKWKGVVEAADAFKSEAPDDPLTTEVEYDRGRALQQLARWDEARAAYRAVIDARRGGDLAARAQLMIGETYYHQKDYHEAIRQFLKAEILYDAPPWQAAALLEAGKAYEQLAQWADAAETYERLRAKFPDDPAARDAKGRLDEVKARLGGGGGTAPAADGPSPGA